MSSVALATTKADVNYKITVELNEEEARLFRAFLMKEVTWSEIEVDKPTRSTRAYFELGPVGTILSRIHEELEDAIEDW